MRVLSSVLGDGVIGSIVGCDPTGLGSNPSHLILFLIPEIFGEVMFGNLFALPIRLFNLPLKAVDTVLDTEVSKPLEDLAEVIEEVIEEITERTKG